MMVRSFWFGAVVFAGALVAAAPGSAVAAPHAASSGRIYFLDCAAPVAGSGTSSSPWNSLTQVDATVFTPGSRLLVARGGTCDGTLAPLGSGTATAPIKVSAYGTGALPVIDGGANQEAVLLDNQQHWAISDLATTGGDRYGILIEGHSSTPMVLSGITISDVVVSDVSGEATTATGKGSGLIYMAANGEQTFNDVTVSHVLAYGTQQWGGIVLGGGEFPDNPGTNITVEDSVVHDVGGDGILIGEADGARSIGNVAYDTGMIITPTVASTIGTPSAIWDFNCHHCLVDGNVAFDSHSSNSDGGDYDIDTASGYQTVVNNFGGPSDGYCGSIFSTYGLTDPSGTFADNLCIDNGSNPSLSWQGAIFLSSFGSEPGCLDGVNVSGNTVYWGPASGAPLLDTEAYSGGQALYCGSSPDVFQGNTLIAQDPDFVLAGSPLALDHNTYIDSTGATPGWTYDGSSYSSFSAYKTGSGQDGSSRFVEGGGGPPDPVSSSMAFAERLGANAGPTTQPARAEAGDAWRHALEQALDASPFA